MVCTGPGVRPIVIVVICLRQRQAVDCDCLPWGSVGALGCDWEQQVSSLDTGQLTWTLPDVNSGLYPKNNNQALLLKQVFTLLYLFTDIFLNISIICL